MIMSEKATTRVTFTISTEKKTRAESVANRMGLSLSSAIQVFVERMIKDDGMPFRPTNKNMPFETAEAFKAIQNNLGLKKYSVDEFEQYLSQLDEDQDD